MVDFLLLSFITRGHLDLQTSNTGENHVFFMENGGVQAPLLMGDFSPWFLAILMPAMHIQEVRLGHKISHINQHISNNPQMIMIIW